MKAIKDDKQFELQIIATAMHLSPEFGLTVNEIEKDGFTVNEKIEMLLSADTDTAIVKSMGLAMISASDVFKRLSPDLLIVLGDRYEMMSITTSAYLLNIPVAHIAGGETTEGAFDEGIRHSITKMSSLHFVSTDIYKKRVLQMGEDPENVFNVGALGLDNIRGMKLFTKEELENDLKLSFSKPTALVTFHPVTIGDESPREQFQRVLNALDNFSDMTLIFTMPNSDTGGRELIEMVNSYTLVRNNAYSFTSLGQKRYLSTLKYVDLVIGNSSSGIVEVPFMNIPTVNIGDRQKGRIMGASIINVDCETSNIIQAINLALSDDAKIKSNQNPYGDGTTAQQILKVIKDKIDSVTIKKSFFDI